MISLATAIFVRLFTIRWVYWKFGLNMVTPTLALPHRWGGDIFGASIPSNPPTPPFSKGGAWIFLPLGKELGGFQMAFSIYPLFILSI
jgi:hypothetical protein